MTKTLTIDKNDAGQRVDSFLRKLLPDAPHGLVQKLIRTGQVRVDGGRTTPAGRLEAGMRLEIRDQRAAEGVRSFIEQENGMLNLIRPVSDELEILFEDEHILALNKPSGLPSHGGSGAKGDSALSRAWTHLGTVGRGHTFRPALPHRLDIGTSGVLMVAKTAEALRSLTAQFRNREVSKHYLALVSGVILSKSGTIRHPLRRVDAQAGDMPKVVVAKRRGQSAESEYEVKETFEIASLLQIILHTGRTHQIRAHFSAIGHPLVGDDRYGFAATNKTFKDKFNLECPFLHAERLVIQHPKKKSKTLEFEAALPDIREELLQTLRDGWRPPRLRKQR
ncbi:RluA family pseudouridine synthase [Gemmatimonadota bacterium]